MFALLAGIACYAVKQAAYPTEAREATVVRFGLSSDYEGNNPLVVVRTSDGRLHQLHAHRSKLIGCKTGAPIRLMKRGTLLSVDPAGCRANRRN